jgi:hypothetical protein
MQYMYTAVLHFVLNLVLKFSTLLESEADSEATAVNLVDLVLSVVVSCSSTCTAVVVSCGI